MTNTAQPNRVKLTQRLAESTPLPADGYKTLWDITVPGFGLRISSKGRRSWIAFYRIAGSQQQVAETIGTMTVIPGIVEARERAKASMVTAAKGIHPVKQRQQPAPEIFTLAKLIEQFIRQHHERRGSRPKTIYSARRLLKRALAILGDKPVTDIKKADILLLINKLADTRITPWRGNTGGALNEAAGVLVHLRGCLRFAAAEGLIERDPSEGIRNPLAGKRERERVLNETEIKALWQVCDEVSYPFGAIIQLLVLTGQRLREVGELPWSELDLPKRVWHLPGERAKNGHAHDIHLSDLALEIIGRLPRFADHGDKDFVFTVSGARAVTTYSAAKAQIDQLLAAKLGTVKPWTFHDLRRSCATHMAGLGVGHHIVEKILNHVSGKISGIAAIYNRAEYLPERKAALDTWGRHVEQLVGANVVALRAG